MASAVRLFQFVTYESSTGEAVQNKTEIEIYTYLKQLKVF